MDNDMGGKSDILQPKQERVMRTRWTPALDKIYADLVVEQIKLGNRPNKVFDKKTWNQIREKFNKQTALNFNHNQLRKHLDVLRTRFDGLKSSINSNVNDFIIGDSSGIDFDVWDDYYEAQPRVEQTRAKDCPILEQLSTIFAESRADGEYAQSSHYEALDKPPVVKSDEDRDTPPCATPAQKVDQSAPEKKRKRSSEKDSVPGKANSDQDLSEVMAKAMFDMLEASKLRRNSQPTQNEKFTITNCVKVLDDIEAEEGMEIKLYFAAVDLFEDANIREMFISLKSNKIRLAWLQGKCRNICSSSRIQANDL